MFLNKTQQKLNLEIKSLFLLYKLRFSVLPVFDK